MNHDNYLTCPKCSKIYHHKAGDDCPNCRVNIPAYLKKQKEKQESRERLAQLQEAGKLAVACGIDAAKINYCTQCGSKFARPKTNTRGSFFIEIFLWLLLLIPGIIYSLWRLTTRYKSCPVCGSSQIIPTSSPAAQAALNAAGQNT